MLFLNKHTGLGYFIITTYQNNLIHKVWVNLINEKQQNIQGFLDKISESSISRGQWVLPENYNYLNPTELLDLRCSVVQLIPLECGSIVVLV